MITILQRVVKAEMNQPEAEVLQKLLNHVGCQTKPDEFNDIEWGLLMEVRAAFNDVARPR